MCQISAETDTFKFLDQICSINMHSTFGICCISFTNSRTNIFTKNLKTLEILPFYRLYTKAWPKIRKHWVNPKKCERRKKAITTGFTEVNVKIGKGLCSFWESIVLKHICRKNKFLLLWYAQCFLRWTFAEGAQCGRIKEKNPGLIAC